MSVAPLSFLAFPPKGHLFTAGAPGELVGRTVDVDGTPAVVTAARLEHGGRAARLTVLPSEPVPDLDLTVGFHVSAGEVTSLERTRKERDGAPGWKGRNHGKHRRPRRVRP